MAISQGTIRPVAPAPPPTPTLQQVMTAGYKTSTQLWTDSDILVLDSVTTPTRYAEFTYVGNAYNTSLAGPLLRVIIPATIAVGGDQVFQDKAGVIANLDDIPVPTIPDLDDVLSAGNSSSNLINLLDGVTQVIYQKTGVTGSNTFGGLFALSFVGSGGTAQGVLDLYNANGGLPFFTRLVNGGLTASRQFIFPDRSGTPFLTNQFRISSATLVAGTVTVADGSALTTSRAVCSVLTPGGTLGANYDFNYSAGSYTITSILAAGTANILDTSTLTVIIFY